jgi:hypothetical protein
MGVPEIGTKNQNSQPSMMHGLQRSSTTTSCDGHPIGKKRVLMTPGSTPREVLPPQGLFRIQGWNRYKDWGKTIATMGWMQFWSFKIFHQFFVHFWLPTKCQLWVSIQTVYSKAVSTGLFLGNTKTQKHTFPPTKS